MSPERSLRRAERIEDVSIALAVAGLAVIAIMDILLVPTKPLRLELWLFHRIGAVTVVLVAVAKCSVALVPIGMLGGLLVRRAALPAWAVALIVALVFQLPSRDLYWSVVAQNFSLGAVVGLALLLGARLRRRIANPRPAFPADAGVRLSVVVLDILLVPVGVLTFLFGNSLLFDTQPHSWVPGATTGTVTLFLLAVRWLQASRSPAGRGHAPTPAGQGARV